MTAEPGIKSMADLAAALNRVRIRQGMTLLELDHLAALQNGYSAKIVCGLKSLGPLSLSGMLMALNCELRVVLSPGKQNDNANNQVTYEVFHREERKKISSAGGKARALSLTASRRREIAKLGALARAAKYEKARCLGNKLDKIKKVVLNSGNGGQGELF
jgi:hypothetical protein